MTPRRHFEIISPLVQIIGQLKKMVQLIIFDLRDFDIKLFCYKTKHVTMVHSLYEAPIAQIIFQLKSTSRILATVLHVRSGL